MAKTMTRLDQFAERLGAMFNDAELHVHIRQLNESVLNPQLRCEMNLFTERGRYSVTEEAFGANLALRKSLAALKERLDRAIGRGKLRPVGRDARPPLRHGLRLS
jgi:hypothetical protein